MLREYQVKLISDTVQAAHQHKRVLVQAPTGSGKSVVFAELIRRAVAKCRDVLFLVHRRELIYQAQAHLARVGVNAGIIMAGEKYVPAPVQLASVQTLYRRLDRLDMSRFGLVIIDEAHHHGARTYVEILSKAGYPGFRNGAWKIGFTATPIRKGGQLLGDVFDTLVLGPTIKDLQEHDPPYLAQIEYMSGKIPDLTGIKTTGGDYSEKGLQEKAVPQLVGGVVDHYLSYGRRKGIIFSCGQRHSFYLKEDFARHGREAIVIDSRTPEDERKELDERFRAAESGILLNCGIFTEGYDMPDCDTLVLAKPTKSLGHFLQMAGRGMRGESLLIIDHGANIYRHGLVEDDREWSLSKVSDKAKIEEEQSERIRKYAACPDCGTMITGKICHTCGHAVTNLEIAKNVRELKHCGLKLIDKKLKHGGVAVVPTSAAWNSIVGLCAMKNWSMGVAAQRFNARFGMFPWKAKLGEPLPPWDGWKMKAREWMEIRA